MTIPNGQFTFRVIGTIGAGGLGLVEEAVVVESNCRHLVGSRLARKKLNARWKNEPQARTRFEREILAVKAMSHPQIIAHEGENLPTSPERFYFMPLYPQSLRDFLARRGSGLPVLNVARFGISLADALAHAHAAGFFHRDLKPENILLDDDARAVIADWGLGYFVHKTSRVLAKLTHAGMGTEYYCSLEQWNSGKCDATGDIYSLGLVLAELLLGRQVPIATVGMGIQHDVVVSSRPEAQAMNALLREMSYVLPRGRVQSMEEVQDRLRMIVGYEIAMAV